MATHLRLGEIHGAPFNPLMQQLALSEQSAFEDARAAGDALVADWDLGEIPARRLAEVAEEKLGILVLNVDSPVGVSGAACHHARFNTILIKRLTWNGLSPSAQTLPKLFSRRFVERLHVALKRGAFHDFRRRGVLTLARSTCWPTPSPSRARGT